MPRLYTKTRYQQFAKINALIAKPYVYHPTPTCNSHYFDTDLKFSMGMCHQNIIMTMEILSQIASEAISKDKNINLGSMPPDPATWFYNLTTTSSLPSK